MKIKKVSVNNRKKTVEIETATGPLSMPFSRLELQPTVLNKIVKIFVDKELASHAVTYILASGEEDSVHVDAFLDYNRDPEFVRITTLHRLTVEAIALLKESKLSKHEIVRRLKTSPSQVYRLLDPKNQRKSVDEMLKLLSVLGYRVEWNLVKEVA